MSRPRRKPKKELRLAGTIVTTSRGKKLAHVLLDRTYGTFKYAGIETQTKGVRNLRHFDPKLIDTGQKVVIRRLKVIKGKLVILVIEPAPTPKKGRTLQ